MKAFALSVALLSCTTIASAREWVDSTGRYRVDAEFVQVINGKARLRKQGGTMVDVPIVRLSQLDQAWIEREVARRGNQLAPELRKTDEAQEKATDEIEGDFTMAIVGSEMNAGRLQISVFPGSTLWVELAENEPDAGFNLQKLFLGQPGSLLFIADGGIGANSLTQPATAAEGGGKADLSLKYVSFGLNGKKSALGTAQFKEVLLLNVGEQPIEHQPLVAGRFYKVDSSAGVKPERDGTYFVHVTFDQDQMVLDEPSSSAETVGKIASTTAVRLVLPGRDVRGWHRVRTLDKNSVEGWVRGPWATAVFTSLSIESEQMGTTLELGQILGTWEAIDQSGNTLSFVPVVGRRMRTEGGLEIETKADIVPDGGMVAKTADGVLKTAFFRFVNNESIECTYVLGQSEILKLQLRGNLLTIRSNSGDTASYRKAPSAESSDR